MSKTLMLLFKTLLKEAYLNGYLFLFASLLSSYSKWDTTSQFQAAICQETDF